MVNIGIETLNEHLIPITDGMNRGQRPIYPLISNLEQSLNDKLSCLKTIIFPIQTLDLVLEDDLTLSSQNQNTMNQ